MPISKRVQEQLTRASWIRRMFEEGARLRGEHGASAVADLSLGNPQIEPPEAFRRALAEAVADPRPGLHRYMSNLGLAATRAAVAEGLSVEAGVALTADHVAMVTGAAAGLNLTFAALLDPGDEVLILSPYFPEYPFYVENHGGVLRIAPTRSDFHLDLEAIADRLGPRTRIVLINSPNNPTGVTYPRPEVEQLAELMLERAPGAYLVSDEPYKRIVFEGGRFTSVLGLHPRAIAVGSHSKDLAIPGERIGYVALSPLLPEADRKELITALGLVMRTYGFVNAPALMQRVVSTLQGVTVDPAFYQARRDLLVGGLREAGYEVAMPTGAFYLFLKTPTPDDVEFVLRLAQERVLTVPGSGFGAPGDLRISYCVVLEQIERALPAFRRLAAEY
ncbi:MAG: pyridoxal phosphate-dependent aminotransferase, partial [Planctomycetota bacterium]